MAILGMSSSVKKNMIFIKNAKIIDPRSSWNGRTADIIIKNGAIEKIGKKLKQPEEAELIAIESLHISPGWLDVGTQVGEPGLEHREDLESVSRAARAGGYTGVACFPNTEPVVQSKAMIHFLKNHKEVIDFYPIGALSQNCKGKELAELYDMADAGAVAFSDGNRPVQSSGLLQRGLEYLKGIGGLLVNVPLDDSLAHGGQIHEGVVSTSLGLPGLSRMSELLMLKRDLDLLAYTESRLLVHQISTAESVELIRAAKKRGLNVRASVAVMNLIFTDKELQHFEVNYKVMPPLRAAEDIRALQDGLKDGTIDFVTSNHVPVEQECKKMEFMYADFGAIGLETSFALLCTHLGEVFSIEEIINFLAINSSNVLGIDCPVLEVGQRANLTLFNPEEKWTYTAEKHFSKSTNSPFLGKNLTGRAKGIVKTDRIWRSY